MRKRSHALLREVEAKQLMTMQNRHKPHPTGRRDAKQPMTMQNRYRPYLTLRRDLKQPMTRQSRYQPRPTGRRISRTANHNADQLFAPPNFAKGRQTTKTMQNRYRLYLTLRREAKQPMTKQKRYRPHPTGRRASQKLETDPAQLRIIITRRKSLTQTGIHTLTFVILLLFGTTYVFLRGAFLVKAMDRTKKIILQQIVHSTVKPAKLQDLLWLTKFLTNPDALPFNRALVCGNAQKDDLSDIDFQMILLRVASGNQE